MEKCEQCIEITQMKEFDAYSQYISVRKSMEQRVSEGLFEKMEGSCFEILYRCKSCNTVWALAEPDFPVRGYFVQR